MRFKISFILSIFVLFLIVILSSGLSFSRYTTTVCNTGDESTIITVNKYNLNANWSTEPQDLQHPGISDQTYNFTLSNGYPDHPEIETEALSYTITVSMDWNEETPVIGLQVPLNMQLYIVNPDESLTLVDTTPTGINVNSIVTQEAIINGNQDIGFLLVWNWGTNVPDRDYRFANKQIDVQIDVNAEQVVE